MNVKEEQICRICLNENYKGFEVLDETTRHMFDVLLVKMKWDITKDPLMCLECAEITRKCFMFKMTCVNTENILRGTRESGQTVVGDDFSTCRFCMDQLERCRLVSLRTLPNELEMLPTFMPEMDISTMEDPVICAPCRENLERYLKFAQNCANVEERICKYCQDGGISTSGLINLRDVVSVLPKDVLEYPVNVTLLPVIKKETDPFEEILIKTEESLDAEDDKLDFVATSSKSPSDEFITYPYKQEVMDTACTCNVKTDCNKCTCRTLLPVKNNSEVVKMYKCSVCTFETKYKRYLSTHSLIHKDASETTMYKCTMCSFETKRKRCLTVHYLTHKNPSEIKMYKCPECTYETRHKCYLTRHLLIHKDASETKIYKCSDCTYETNYKSSLYRHFLVHKDASETEMHKCPYCAYETKYKNVLANHVITHKDASETTMYKCSVCTFETKSKRYLSNHLLTHKDASEIKMHKCLVCSFETKHRKNLAGHLRIHKDASETEMYKCSVCSYETKHRRYLNAHLLIHKDASETKLHKCSVCAYETIHKRNLLRHLRMHEKTQQKLECDNV